MKKTIIYLMAIYSINLAFAKASYSQNDYYVGGNIGIGFVTNVYYGYWGPTSSSVPKQINVIFSIPMANSTFLNLSAGLGFSTYKYTKDYDDEKHYSTWETKERKRSLSGYQLEGEVVFSPKLLNTNMISLFGGIGGGFYHYTFKEKVVYLDDTNEYPDEIISGLSQYFTFGFKIYINSNVFAFTQFKKMGYSLIKVKYDLEDEDDKKIGEAEYNLTTSPGLTDIGISIGISFKF